VCLVKLALFTSGMVYPLQEHLLSEFLVLFFTKPDPVMLSFGVHIYGNELDHG
jgi:hypothetical protein